MRYSRERETTEESPCVNADAGCNYSSAGRFPGAYGVRNERPWFW